MKVGDAAIYKTSETVWLKCYISSGIGEDATGGSPNKVTVQFGHNTSNPICSASKYTVDKDKVKPIKTRSWLTTQADIDCQGKY